MIIKKNFFNFFFILGIFLTDRLSKYLIIEFDKTNVEPEYTILPFLNFNLIWNEGIAFGLFSFADKSNYNILTIIIIFVTAIIFWMIIKTKELEKLGFMMIFGGSLGNIFDRVYYSSVQILLIFIFTIFIGLYLM